MRVTRNGVEIKFKSVSDLKEFVGFPQTKTETEIKTETETKIETKIDSGSYERRTWTTKEENVLKRVWDNDIYNSMKTSKYLESIQSI